MDIRPFSPADLPINSDGSVYHLCISPADLAQNIVIVGDPDRVPLLAERFFKSIEVDVAHRGLRTITGRVGGSNLRVSLVTSGMGTPSLEIILCELIALNEIDFERRVRKSHFDPLHIIRLGTSGGLRKEVPMGTLVITKYAVGMDNTGLFYEAPLSDPLCEALENEIKKRLDERLSSSRFLGKINPYCSVSDDSVISALARSAERFNAPHAVGITVSNSGFFANQGRDILRIPPSVRDLDRFFAEFELDDRFGDLCIQNMEMETSLLCHICGGIGYKAGAVCTTIADRINERFDLNYKENILLGAKVALCALSLLTDGEDAFLDL
ncbi:MAG: uridine phosphorylase [Candidatus Dadabacteria bacterium]|nr:MAG: uridine phosphorylase [Candidatus Dadabacteria bacterium]